MSTKRIGGLFTDHMKGRKRKQRHNIFTKLVAHICLLVGSITMGLPFVWTVATSLKTQLEVFQFPPTWIPHPVMWQNYVSVFQRFPFTLFLFNSTYITVVSIVGQLLTCSLAGYAFARLRFPGKNLLFLGYLATLMIPYQVTMIPLFLIMRNFGWIDSHKSLIIPFIAGPFGTFLMRQFFLNIPRELSDAARIDGCNPFSIYWRIMLPLAKPALATLGIFTFMWSWNSFLWPLIMINTTEKKTVTLGLAAFRGEYGTMWNEMMAATIICLLPILVSFLLAQKYFVRGIALTGIKA